MNDISSHLSTLEVLWCSVYSVMLSWKVNFISVSSTGKITVLTDRISFPSNLLFPKWFSSFIWYYSLNHCNNLADIRSIHYITFWLSYVWEQFFKKKNQNVHFGLLLSNPLLMYILTYCANHFDDNFLYLKFFTYIFML